MGIAAHFFIFVVWSCLVITGGYGNAWGGIQADDGLHPAVGDRCQCNAAERPRGVAAGIGVAAVCGARRKKRVVYDAQALLIFCGLWTHCPDMPPDAW